MRRIPLCSVFFDFLDWGFCFAEKSFWRVVSLDVKKRFALQFLVPLLKKYEKIHEPFLMMVTTLIFTPKRKSLVSFVQRLFGGGRTDRTIRLSLSFTLMCGLLGFIHAIFSRLEFFLIPLYDDRLLYFALGALALSKISFLKF